MDTNSSFNPIGDLLNVGLGGAPQLSGADDGIQSLIQLLQPTPDPQSANAALGPSTTNVLNNAANLSGNPNMAAGNYDATQNTGINQQQAIQVLQGLTKSMGGVSNQPNAYQKGAAKRLTEAGYDHVDTALKAGMNPLDIANHDVLQSASPPQNTNSQGTTQDSGQNNQQSNQQPNIQDQINSNIMQRLLQASQAPQGALGQFGQNVRDLSGLSAARNANTESIQSQSGNQKDAQAQYQTALSDEVKQKMAGKEPLQASDYANIVGGMNTLNLDALKTASQKMDDDLKERQSEIESSQKTVNMMGRLGGLFNTDGQTVTGATKAAQNEIIKLKQAKAVVDAKIANFKPNNPVNSKIGLQAPSGATHYSPSTGKYYDAQGQEMK